MVTPRRGGGANAAHWACPTPHCRSNERLRWLRILRPGSRGAPHRRSPPLPPPPEASLLRPSCALAARVVFPRPPSPPGTITGSAKKPPSDWPRCRRHLRTISSSGDCAALVCKAAAPRPTEGPAPTANAGSTLGASSERQAPQRPRGGGHAPRPHPGASSAPRPQPSPPAVAPRLLRCDATPCLQVGDPGCRPRPETQDGGGRVTDCLSIPEALLREPAEGLTLRGSERTRAGLWCHLIVIA